jgi:aspartyl-tRNA synthetase
MTDVGQVVTLAGWAARIRTMGGMAFIDIRDRYGITQLAFNDGYDAEILQQATQIGREFVIQATGKVAERESKNAQLPTGDVEVIVTDLKVLNAAKTPPFLIENETDGGDDLRMRGIGDRGRANGDDNRIKALPMIT